MRRTDLAPVILCGSWTEKWLMIGIREFRAGIKVFARHLHNAQGDPQRLRWVLARTCKILLSGKVAGILQRHAVMDDLYTNYPECRR